MPASPVMPLLLIVQSLARVPALGSAQIQQVVGLTADATAALGGTDQAAVAEHPVLVRCESATAPLQRVA